MSDRTILDAVDPGIAGRRNQTRRSLRRIVPLLAAALLALTGCVSGPSQPTPGSASPSSSDYDEVPQADGLSEIDVDGTEGSPITWQLPDGSTASDPVGVTQRFIALYLHAGTPGAEPRVELSTSVGDDGALAILGNQLRDPTHDGDARSAGPLWIWLNDAEENGDNATVRGCMDVGYFQPYGSLSYSRGTAWHAYLVRIDDFDGRPVWKVDRFNAGPVNDANPFEAQCAAWATHTP